MPCISGETPPPKPKTGCCHLWLIYFCCFQWVIAVSVLLLFASAADPWKYQFVFCSFIDQPEMEKMAVVLLTVGIVIELTSLLAFHITLTISKRKKLRLGLNQSLYYII